MINMNILQVRKLTFLLKLNDRANDRASKYTYFFIGKTFEKKSSWKIFFD